MIILTAGMVMVTLVIIIILMIMNIMDPMDSTQALTDAQNGVVQTSEPVSNTQEEEVINKASKFVDEKYYHYEGKLSDKPITPNTVENSYMIKYCVSKLDDSKKEEAVQLAVKSILDYAKNYECYANPTIILGPEPIMDFDFLYIDLHTRNNDMLGLYFSESSYKFSLYDNINYNFNQYSLVESDVAYCFNISLLYNYLVEEEGYGEQLLLDIQEEILKTLKWNYENGYLTADEYNNMSFYTVDNYRIVYDGMEKNIPTLVYFVRVKLDDKTVGRFFHVLRLDKEEYDDTYKTKITKYKIDD